MNIEDEVLREYMKHKGSKLLFEGLLVLEPEEAKELVKFCCDVAINNANMVKVSDNETPNTIIESRMSKWKRSLHEPY